MTPSAFVEKWDAVARSPKATERANAQSHFNDLCTLLGEPQPQDEDPTGRVYGFEVGVKKTGGGNGWADVYRQNCFGWEYKKPSGDLKRAHNQLKQYADDLLNPPYLVVSDINVIRVHTNWTNTVSAIHEFGFDDLFLIGKRSDLRDVLRGVETFKPKETRQELTARAARRFVGLAEELRADGHPASAVAHFINRLVFCMFAEDTGILPKGLFSRLLVSSRQHPGTFERQCGALFEAMAQRGGFFGADPVEWVNGGLFENATTLPLKPAQLDRVRKAAELQWDQLDPSILGTLFERGLDPSKRGQLGAHYTDAECIERIVLPVVVAPLQREWEAVKVEIKAIPVPASTERIKYKNAIERRAKPFRAFRNRLKAVRVLDPACGSGNFLYTALRALRDLELRVVNEGEGLLIPKTILELGPENVLGIELNEYAADLARVSVWIGNLQWSIEHGFGFDRDPVLGTLEGIQRRDALLNEDGTEATWPAAEFIVGNPPFLGDKKMREGLDDAYVDRVRKTYAGRVPGSADFVTFWFAKAGEALRIGTTHRVGLVSTNNIRKGKSNEVLRNALEGSRLFTAWADTPWHDEQGAAVRVSISCFGCTDANVSEAPQLNGVPVLEILPTLPRVRKLGR